MLILAAAHQAGWLGQAIDLGVEWLLEWPPAWLFALITAALGFWRVNGGFALFVLLGFNLVLSMELWSEMIATLSLVLTASGMALLIGLPLGILSARSRLTWRLVRPCLDLMQTMPAFVYLIPAVMLFSTGAVPSIPVSYTHLTLPTTSTV